MRKIILFFNSLALVMLAFMLAVIFRVWSESIYVSLFETAMAILVTLIAPSLVFIVLVLSFALHESNDASWFQRIMPIVIFFLLVQSWLFHGTPWVSFCLALFVCAVSVAWIISVCKCLKS